MRKQAIIFGATGAVGQKLLALCLFNEDYEKVTVIARRPASIIDNKLHWIEASFDHLENLQLPTTLEKGDAYCCLGTTIKTAGSKTAFRRVDYDYIVEAAKFSKRCGIGHFSLVSAIGADSQSISFYSRVKGETEAAVTELAFPQLSIFRPSLLEGDRDEFRIKEAVASWLSLLLTPIFYLGLRKYQPIGIDQLAQAIYKKTLKPESTDSVCIFESDTLHSH